MLYGSAPSRGDEIRERNISRPAVGRLKVVAVTYAFLQWGQGPGRGV
jgi:hypothetical protein